MPKIVDKIEKRKTIAKSTCSLFVKKGFVNISISEIARTAGVGKGTVYEYFDNKEDIIFELMSCLQNDYDPKLQKALKKSSSTKEKIKSLFALYLNNDEITRTQRQIYREFLAIYLNNPTTQMKKYYKQLKEKYSKVLETIFYEAIKNNELEKSILQFNSSIFATMDGFFIIEASNETYENYFDMLLYQNANSKNNLELPFKL